MISKEINRKLFGYLVFYYRKKLRLSREAFIEKIGYTCSNSSLSRIENGKEIFHDDIYKTIIDGLGFELGLDYYSYSTLNEYAYRLQSIINSGAKISSYIYFYNEISSFYLKHDKTFYISHFCRLYIAVLNAYLYNKIDDYEIAHIFDDNLIALDNDAKNFAYYLIYKSALFRFDSNIFIHEFSYYGKQIDGTKIFYLEQANYDIYCLSISNMYKKYINLYESQDNRCCISNYSILSALACCELNLGDYEASLKHLKESLMIDNIKKIIPDSAILQTYKRMGINEYCLKNYKNCFSHLNYIRKENSNALGMNYLLLLKSAELIGKTDVIISICEDFGNIQANRLLKKIVYYYKMKYIDKASIIDLENYICSNLAKSNFTSSMYLNIFVDEVMFIVSKTKHYIVLYNFLTK